jgi:photoactive yellow protein
MATTTPVFDTPDLARHVETLRDDEIDALPFGAIRIDEAGVVRHYSRAEARLSGRGEKRTTLGRTFFAEIAPCMDTPAYRGRIERAIAAGRLDLEFGHVGDFADRSRELRVRVQSAKAGGYWVFMQRTD